MESNKEELRLLKNMIKRVFYQNFAVINGVKVFEEAEILSFLLEAQWSPKVKILIISFLNLAKKYEKFAIISLKFVIKSLLSLQSKTWFTTYKTFEKMKEKVLKQLKAHETNQEITIENLLKIQKLLYSNTSLFFDKAGTDMFIVESFILTLNEYKGLNIEDCVKIKWVKDINPECGLKLVKGLILENSLKIQGFYDIIHFSQSNFN